MYKLSGVNKKPLTWENPVNLEFNPGRQLQRFSHLTDRKCPYWCKVWWKSASIFRLTAKSSKTRFWSPLKSMPDSFDFVWLFIHPRIICYEDQELTVLKHIEKVGPILRHLAGTHRCYHWSRHMWNIECLWSLVHLYFSFLLRNA